MLLKFDKRHNFILLVSFHRARLLLGLRSSSGTELKSGELDSNQSGVHFLATNGTIASLTVKFLICITLKSAIIIEARHRFDNKFSYGLLVL